MSRIGRFLEWQRRQVPTGLLGALVLIVVVERHVEQNVLDYLSGSQWGYRNAAKVATNEARDCKLLCFGDSLLKLGLAPQVIEAESGLRGYNLSLAGGQAPGSYFLLRRALEAGARPEAIVVDFFPSMLATTPHFNDENFPVVTDLRDCFDLARTLGEPAEFARLAVPCLLPSARSRTALRFNLALALNPSPVSIRAEILRALRNWRANQGAEITLSKPNAPTDLESWERGFFDGFRCLPENQAYVDRFLDLAASHAIPVFWLLPPYQPVLQRRTELSGFDAAHETFLVAIQGRHPNLFVIDARHSGYEREVFVDLHHLGREGAAVFSSDVGKAIRRHLREDRSPNAWTALPRYLARGEPVPLEDGEQSRLVVAREMKKGIARRLVR